jgi:hypothetical protein
MLIPSKTEYDPMAVATLAKGTPALCYPASPVRKAADKPPVHSSPAFSAYGCAGLYACVTGVVRYQLYLGGSVYLGEDRRESDREAGKVHRGE